MTVNELIKRFHDNEVDEFLYREYVPYSEKLAIVNSIVEVITYKQDGLITYDTNQLEIHSLITFIKAYIDLDIDNLFDDYDLLMQNNSISYLLHNHDIIKSEFEVMNKMLWNKLNDLQREYNSVEAVINHNLGLLIDTATSTINNLNNKISETDVKTLNKNITIGIQSILDAIKIK